MAQGKVQKWDLADMLMNLIYTEFLDQLMTISFSKKDSAPKRPL
jgi:hypothetical protein